MAESTQNPSENDTETKSPVLKAVIATPFGPIEIDTDKLPAQLREALAEGLGHEGVPTSIRDGLGKIFGLPTEPNADEAADGHQSAAHAAGDTEAGLGAQNAADAEAEAAAAESDEEHGPDCRCAVPDRAELWAFLDNAFPNDPHMWQALEGLMNISEGSPYVLDDETRRSVLRNAIDHIEAHIEQKLTTPLSPTDQLLAAFRIQLG